MPTLLEQLNDAVGSLISKTAGLAFLLDRIYENGDFDMSCELQGAFQFAI
jgi:hypothetical protein